MKSKHTKGFIGIERTSSTLWVGTLKGNGKVNEIICDFDIEGMKISAVENSLANAQLICDAFNVANETGMTPRELQKSHAEMLEALEELVGIKAECLNYADYANDASEEIAWAFNDAEQAITNATKK